MKFYNILKNYLSNKRNQLIKISLFVAISFSIICNFTNILNLILNAKIVKNYHQLSKNSSNQQIPYLQNLTEDIKDSKEKVAITFRLQNIYRISLNCYWTKFMGLHQKILYDYKYRKSIKFCRHPKDSAEVLVDTTSEMIIKMQNEIKKKDIRVIDNHFVDFFPTNKLIEGGWFPGYKGRNRSFFFSDSNTKCIPMERIAILVPYRDREDNLNSFLAYMHFYLQKQEKAYKIFVIEQSNENKVFNKGRLYNMGFKYIIENEKEWEFNCIILHDVDLLPVNFSLDYTCSNMPKHMSTNVIRLVDNSKLAHYHFLTGGVLALRPEQYKIINGYSNEYWGWGGEDDDFSIRIIHKELCLLRTKKEISKYIMVEHNISLSSVNNNRWDLIMSSTNRIDEDGFSNIHEVSRILKLEKYYKYLKILVDVSL